MFFPSQPLQLLAMYTGSTLGAANVRCGAPVTEHAAFWSARRRLQSLTTFERCSLLTTPLKQRARHIGHSCRCSAHRNGLEPVNTGRSALLRGARLRFPPKATVSDISEL